MSYKRDIRLTDSSFIGLSHKDIINENGDLLYTISLSTKGSGNDSVIYADVPEGRLTDIKNLIDEAINSPRDES